MAKKAPDILTSEEVDALVEAASNSGYYYTLFNVAKYTGRRLGEIYNIRVMDIDFENKTIGMMVLKRRARVKKDAVMTDDLAKLIKRYIEKRRLKLEDYLFHKYQKRTIQYAIKKYAKKAGIKKNVMFHSFRHHFVTQLTKRGWTPYQIIQLTGHSNIGGLNPYSHMVLEDVKEDALKTLKEI